MALIMPNAEIDICTGFNEFVHEREMKGPNDPTIMLFDQVICSKRNRGRTSWFSKSNTNFLWNTSDHLWRSAAATPPKGRIPGEYRAVVTRSKSRPLFFKNGDQLSFTDRFSFSSCKTRHYHDERAASHPRCSSHQHHKCPSETDSEHARAHGPYERISAIASDLNLIFLLPLFFKFQSRRTAMTFIPEKGFCRIRTQYETRRRRQMHKSALPWRLIRIRDFLSTITFALLHLAPCHTLRITKRSPFSMQRDEWMDQG